MSDNHVIGLTRKSGRVLQEFSSFFGSGHLIRTAIITTSKEAEDKAWRAVKPAVVLMETLHRHCDGLASSFPALLEALDALPPLNPESAAWRTRATGYFAVGRQVAGVLDFMLRFDQLKTATPEVQNDFAFYKRHAANRFATNGDVMIMTPERATDVALFMAYANPMEREIGLLLTDQGPEAAGKARAALEGFAAGVVVVVSEGWTLSLGGAGDSRNVMALRAAVGAMSLATTLRESGFGSGDHYKDIVRDLIGAIRQNDEGGYLAWLVTDLKEMV